MPWTDPSPAIGVDKAIRASTHLAIFENFAAMAAGAAGAPRVSIPGAVATTEKDTGLVLRPDGAGGVTWAAVPVAIASGQQVSYALGSPVTVVPASVPIYAIHGTATSTANHQILLPAASTATAGHQVLINIEQLGTFGSSRIIVDGGGQPTLAQWSHGSTWRGSVACDGTQWFIVSEQVQE